MTHALGVDIGTTNVKVALVDDHAAVVASTSRALAMMHEGVAAEQDADLVWREIVDATRELVAAAPDAARTVTSIGVCSQYSSIVPIGADCIPVGPLVMWFDTRGTDHSLEILGREPTSFETWVERHGIPPVGSGLSLGHILYHQHDRPDLHERTVAYVEIMDAINARLTGRITATQTTMFTAQLCDNRTVGVTAYDDDLVRMAGVDADRLPPLIPVDGVAGELTAAAADELGLPVGIEVRAGMNDSHAGAFATGAFGPGRGGLMIGTTAVLLESVDAMAVDLDHEIVSMPAPLADRYVVWAENGVAGKAVQHIVEEFVFADDELGAHAHPDGFERLEATLAATDPGAGDVLFLPWLAGSLSPSAVRAMRGGFLNIGFDTRRVDLVRAAVEGTAHNLAWLLPAVEAFSGARIDEFAFGGGAARSPGWAQILADVLDRPVLRLDRPDVAVARAVGFVALARTSGQEISETDAVVPIAARHEPDPSTRATHDALQEQFEAAFVALRPICEALNASKI
ncbi:MAG TPA: FGGY family carbohydrate kinase [Acidimicrobiia bacterium]|nr:FGGY family carbohydrate kinase [Acidimicrobiia bacterium]